MRVSGPFGEEDGVFGVGFYVGGEGVYDYYFGEVAVEVGEVLEKKRGGRG